MEIPRWQCMAAVLPNNQLMVVGGFTGEDFSDTDSVEFATCTHCHSNALNII